MGSTLGLRQGYGPRISSCAPVFLGAHMRLGSMRRALMHNDNRRLKSLVHPWRTREVWARAACGL